MPALLGVNVTMSDDMKRIIIVDDDFHMRLNPSFLFKNAGFESHVVVADTLEQTMNVLKKWAKQGHRADIVDFDLYMHYLSDYGDDNPFLEEILHLKENRNKGVDAMRFIIEWSRKQREALQVQKFFMHSKAPNQISKIVGNDQAFSDIVTWYETSELRDIAIVGEYGPYYSHDGRTLRTYLNEAFGANYPLARHHAEMLKNPEKEVGISDLISDVNTGYLKEIEALSRIDVKDLTDNLKSEIDLEHNDLHNMRISFENGTHRALAGRAAFSYEDVQSLRKKYPREPVILVINKFEPDDTYLLHDVDGVVLLGDVFEHLELVVSNHDIAAIYGQSENSLSIKDGCLVCACQHKKDFTINTGEWLTIDGSGYFCDYELEDVFIGGLIKGKLPINQNRYKENYWFPDVIGWIEILRGKKGISLKANVDSVDQIRRAVEFGADGVGLLRTEHLFYKQGRLSIVQDVLLSNSLGHQNVFFDAFQAAQKEDFVSIFEAVKTLEKEFPISIRLLDAPPEEFIQKEQIETFVRSVGEGNERGAQLALAMPGLYAAQAEAIFEAARETGYTEKPEIMLPFIKSAQDVEYLKAEIDAVAEKYGYKGCYRFGAMIETKEALADIANIAKQCDFISFGTNDLTADMMGGIKRNNFKAIHDWMIKNGHRDKSPFLKLSKNVEKAIDKAVKIAREANPDIEINICGNQIAGDGSSIKSCQNMGFNALSVPANAMLYFSTLFSVAKNTAKEKLGVIEPCQYRNGWDPDIHEYIVDALNPD